MVIKRDKHLSKRGGTGEEPNILVYFRILTLNIRLLVSSVLFFPLSGSFPSVHVRKHPVGHMSAVLLTGEQVESYTKTHDSPKGKRVHNH